MILRLITRLPVYTVILINIVLLEMAGCGSSDPKDALPPAQADAASKLEAAGVTLKFRDGKVTYVDFNGVRDVATIVHVKALPDVKTLVLVGTTAGDDELVHLADLSELEELALSNTNITDKGLDHLAGLSKMWKLALNGCNVSDAGLLHLQNLKELKQLHLNDTKVSDAGLEHLTGLEKLEALLVYGTAVTPGGAAVFREKRPETMVVTTEGESGAGDESDGQ
jgi:Leucine Rich repeat